MEITPRPHRPSAYFSTSKAFSIHRWLNANETSEFWSNSDTGFNQWNQSSCYGFHNWHKLKLDMSCQLLNVYTKFKLLFQSMLKKVRKTVMDGQADGYGHGIIRPFFKRAYKNQQTNKKSYNIRFYFVPYTHSTRSKITILKTIDMKKLLYRTKGSLVVICDGHIGNGSHIENVIPIWYHHTYLISSYMLKCFR